MLMYIMLMISFFVIFMFFLNFFLLMFLVTELKKSSFESGFLSVGKLIVSFSLSFFFLIMIFVFFDLELFFVLILIYYSVYNYYLFIFVLFFIMLGYLLEWKFSKVKWLSSMYFLKSMLKNFGTSSMLTYSFNLGSMLGLILMMQILTGLMMTFYFDSTAEMAFSSVQYMMFEVNSGWYARLLHFNGASLFFMFLYLHFFKAMFYSSFLMFEVWFMGLMIFIFLMMEAFLGYTLVWSQMSFWAGTVITSLLSVIPIFGKTLVFFIWGGFGLNSNTLKFFYLIHFLVPFIVILMVIFHIIFLHNYGSSSELTFPSKQISQTFYPYYMFKDMINILFFLFFFFFMTLGPFKLGDPLGFEDVNELVSPVHIVPEWYFLWAYAILRAIPSKLMGVMILFLSIIFFLMFFLMDKKSVSKDKFMKKMVLFFGLNGLVLSWLGGSEPLFPYVFLSQMATMMYFITLILILFVSSMS